MKANTLKIESDGNQSVIIDNSTDYRSIQLIRDDSSLLECTIDMQHQSLLIEGKVISNPQILSALKEFFNQITL